MMLTICSVYGGPLCVMTPLILTSDVLLTQALSWESVRLVLNKLWTGFLLLLSLLFFCVSHSLVSLYHVTMFHSSFTSIFGHYLSFKTHSIWYRSMSICYHRVCGCVFQDIQLWNLLVHTQPLHCLLHHPYGAHGRVSLCSLTVCVCVPAWVSKFFCNLDTVGLHFIPLHSRGQDKSFPYLRMSANLRLLLTAGDISISSFSLNKTGMFFSAFLCG